MLRIGTIPFMLSLFLIDQVSQSSLFTLDKIFYKYDSESTPEPTKLRIQKGRTGLMVSIVGMFFLYYGAALVIPMPTQEQEKNIKWNILQKWKKKKNEQEESFD